MIGAFDKLANVLVWFVYVRVTVAIVWFFFAVGFSRLFFDCSCTTQGVSQSVFTFENL